MTRARRLPVVLLLSALITIVSSSVLADSGESTRVPDSGQYAQAKTRGYPYRQKAEYVLKELDLKPGDVVVDIGAGDGWWTEKMVPGVEDKGVIHAAEIDQKKVDKLKSKFADVPQVKPYLCKTDSTELPEDSCDLVFLSQTYHHLNAEGRVGYLERLRKVVKPTGRICVVERYPAIGGGGPKTHGTMLSRLAQDAEQSGWVPVRFEVITGSSHYIAILVQKEVFPKEPEEKKKPKAKAKAKAKADRNKPAVGPDKKPPPKPAS